MDDREPNDESAEQPADAASPEGGDGRFAVLGRLRSRIRGGRRGPRLPGGRRVAIRGRELSLNPRILGVVLLVGLLGFVAGTQYGTAGRPGSSPIPSAGPAATPATTTSPEPSAVTAAGTSAMAVWFDPPKLVSATKDTGACDVLAGPTGAGGVWWQRVWFAHCRLSPTSRDRLIDALGTAMTDGLVATGLTGSGSYFVSNPGGPEVGHWSFESGSLEGSIQLLRYDAGSDVDIVFVISEHVKG